MSGRRVLLLAVLPLLAGCADRGELITLVQRVALVPGVDALDPVDPIPVGQDWETIDFYLTEPLTPSSAAAFNPEVHLSLDGLGLASFAFNTVSEGTIPPYARLTLVLADAGDVPEGSYSVRLSSPEGSRLVGQSGTSYLGDFKFRVSVVARDGKLPYIVRFTPQQISDVPEELTVETWAALALFGGGVVPHGNSVPPHASLRVEFSERMRTPISITGGPEVSTETFVETSFGTQRVLLEEVVGIDFRPTVELVSWADTVDGSRSEFVTALTSETIDGLEIATDYLLEFAGAPPLTSVQDAVKDRSGEPLTFRFASDPVARQLAVTDRRGFRTAPIRINTPDHQLFLNSDAFLGGDVALAIEGEVADFVDPTGPVAEVMLTLRRAVDSVPLVTVATAPFATDEINLTGVSIDRFQATISLPAAAADGDYEIVAEARSASGEAQGQDVVRLTKDTVAASVVAGASFELLATETEAEDVCITASADTARVEILTAGGAVIASETAFAEVLGNPLQILRQFCFDPFELPDTFHGGVNTIQVRLTDLAGNVSVTSASVVIRPALVLVPENVQPGSQINVLGVGLHTLSLSLDQAIFNGATLPLSHGLRADNSDLQTILAEVVPHGSHYYDFVTVRIRVPYFVSSGPLALSVDGVESTARPLGICTEPDGPFVRDNLAVFPVTNPTFLGDITETGVSRLFPTTVLTTAGEPVVVHGSSKRVQAFTWDRIEQEWDSQTIQSFTESSPNTMLPAAAAGRHPRGDAAILYEVETPPLVTVRLARREPATSLPPCNPPLPCPTSAPPRFVARDVASFATGTASRPRPPALSLAFASDGRVGAVYVAPGGVDGQTALFASIETTANSDSFGSPILLDDRPNAGASVSAAFDDLGRLWVAYNRSVLREPVDQIRTNDFNIDVVRIESSGSVRRFSSPGEGLWPSIAIQFGSQARVAYQDVDVAFTKIGDGSAGEGACDFRLRVRVDNPRTSVLVGSSWDSEDIEGRPQREIFDVEFDSDNDQFFDCEVPPMVPEPGNLNLAVPRSVLRVGDDGAKFIYVREKGELVFGKRNDSSGWTTGIAALGQAIGGTVALALDGTGRARVTYDDAALGQRRLWREDDQRSVDPGIDLVGCNAGAFEHNEFTPNINPFILAHNQFPYSVEWLATLPTLVNRVPAPDFFEIIPLSDHDEATQGMFRDMLMTAILGQESSSQIAIPPPPDEEDPEATPTPPPIETAVYLVSTQRGGAGCQNESDPCSRAEFDLSMDYSRGSGQTEFGELRGGVTWVDDTNFGLIPDRVNLEGRVRTSANTLRARNYTALDAIANVPFDFQCFDPSGMEVFPTDVACGISDPSLLVALESTGASLNLFAITISLTALPATFELDDRDDVDVQSVRLRLRGLAFTAKEESGRAGDAQFDIGVRNFDARAQVTADIAGGTLTCNAHATSGGGRIRLTGPLTTVDSGQSGLVGDVQIAGASPSFSLSGTSIDVSGGNEFCGAAEFVDVMARFLGLNRLFTFDGSEADLSDTDIVGIAEPLLLQSAVDDVASRAGAGSAWTVHVPQDGRIHAIVPR